MVVGCIPEKGRWLLRPGWSPPRVRWRRWFQQARGSEVAGAGTPPCDRRGSTRAIRAKRSVHGLVCQGSDGADSQSPSPGTPTEPGFVRCRPVSKSANPDGQRLCRRVKKYFPGE